jgi:hypothetical protein
MCNSSQSNYCKVIDEFVNWCDVNELILNVKKTKEVVFDFRRSKNIHNPVVINGQNVERVESYKYLGTIIDCKLNWEENTQLICNKARKRLFFLRKLGEFKVDKIIMRLFFDSIIRSVLTFNITVWFKNLSQAQLYKLERIIKTASRCINDNVQYFLRDDYLYKIKKFTDKIMSDNESSLNIHFTWLKSGKRLRSIKVRTNRYGRSCIPMAVKLFNESCSR